MKCLSLVYDGKKLGVTAFKLGSLPQKMALSCGQVGGELGRSWIPEKPLQATPDNGRSKLSTTYP